MLASRVFSRGSRSLGRRSLLLLSPTKKQQQQLPLIAHQFHSVVYESPNKFIISQSLLHHSAPNSSTPQRVGFSSSASPKPSEKDHGEAVENNSAEPTKTGDYAKVSDEMEDSGSGETKFTETKESDSEGESDLSMDDMVKLLNEKEELLKVKHEEIKKMKDKVLRTYAEMENVMNRTKREAENSKKFAIQNFAKGLLDVADNLGRASSSVKESLVKIDASIDAAGAAPVIKTLLEGVEMTEKQLLEVFKKFGLEKFDPTNEPFDPHRHNAAFQLPDNSKPPGTVFHVLKPGYMLYDRVIRPADVGVTQAVDKDAS
ncbi:GrpE domain-containing protein [Cephalotus follicularis]|uniref:GrpE domain-containing protein n=1 Tax=Cephalotus follicularis TaxID=3775 RepID=A0A1Q3D049_CEPFO|nr:GrpE domain-containing protein [Cephalotus follicularis]